MPGRKIGTRLFVRKELGLDGEYEVTAHDGVLYKFTQGKESTYIPKGSLGAVDGDYTIDDLNSGKKVNVKSYAYNLFGDYTVTKYEGEYYKFEYDDIGGAIPLNEKYNPTVFYPKSDFPKLSGGAYKKGRKATRKARKQRRYTRRR